jgi:ribokinase
MENQVPIIVVGSANVDYSVFMSKLPKPGETVFGSSSARFPGGKGLNQAVGAHRAGAEVTFQFAHGDDEEGSFLIGFMRKQGMKHSAIQDPLLPTGKAYILVDSVGENQIVVIPGANHSAKIREFHCPKRAGFLILQLEIGSENNLSLARQARSAGFRVVMTPAPSSEFDSQLLEHVDILTLNADEALEIAGGTDLIAAGKALSQRVENVYLTKGSEGVSVFERGELLGHVDAMKVSSIDATAAGDTFCGYLIAGLAEGLDSVSAAKFGTVAAGLTVQALGASESIPLRNRVDEIIMSDSNKPPSLKSIG